MYILLVHDEACPRYVDKNTDLGRLAHASDTDAALQEALHDVVGGGIGVGAGEDGPDLPSAAGCGRYARQDLQQRQQRPRLPCPGRPLAINHVRSP